MHPGHALKRLLKRRPLCVLTLAVVVVSPAPGSHACGFHDDVSISRGALNWTYPDALHVVGAISAATIAKRLVPQDNAAPDPFGARYRATAKALDKFARLLDAGPGETLPSFSLVLVEPMLWSHYDNGPDGLSVEVHTSGPRVGDLVVISGLDVIHAIAGGVLDPSEAFELGLIRLYGTERQTARFRAVVAAQDIDRRTNDNQTVDIRARRSRFGLTQ
jgi:hypothetical protein